MPASTAAPLSVPAAGPVDAGARRTVHVDLAGRPYDIHIGPGLLGEAGSAFPLCARARGWPSSPMPTWRRGTSTR